MRLTGAIIACLMAAPLAAEPLGDTAVDDTMTVCLFGAANPASVPGRLADIGWKTVKTVPDAATFAHRASLLPDTLAGNTDETAIKPTWDSTADNDLPADAVLFDPNTGSLAVVWVESDADRVSITCRIVATRALSGRSVNPLILQLRENKAPAIASLGVQQEEVDGGRRAAAIFVMDSERIERALGIEFPFVSVVMARSEIGQAGG